MICLIENVIFWFFFVSNRKIPAVAGDYEVTFIYKDTFKGELIEIKSSPVSIEVLHKYTNRGLI